MKSSRWTGLFFVSPWLAGFLLLTAGPMLYSLYLSFTSASMLAEPVWVGAENYTTIISSDPLFWISLQNTAYYVAVFVPLSVLLSLALALLLDARVKGLRLFRTLFFLPSVTNVVAVAVLWLWMFNPDFGLLNSVLRVFGIEGPLWLQSEAWAKPALVVMSLWGVGGMTLVFLAALQGMPAEVHEAAMLDGAGQARRFFSITMPLISPTILFNTVMSLIGSFQVFTQAFVMTGAVQPGSEGGPNNATLFFVLYLYKKAFQEFRMGYASALAWILFVLTVGLTWLLLRLSKSRVHYEAGDAR